MDRAEWKKLVGVLIGGVLAVAGIVGIVWCPNPLGVRLSEALFVVGVVATVVYRSKYMRR